MVTSVLNRRGWRIAAIVLGIVAALLIAAYAALRWAFPPQRLATLIAEEVKAATGREFRIAGNLSIHLLPTIAVVANDIALGNAAWASRPDMITLKRASFEVALWPLLHGSVHVLSIDVQGADVLLEVNSRGDANWMLAPPRAPANAAAAASAPEGASAAAFTLDRVTVSNVHIIYHRAPAAPPRAMSIESLRLDTQGDQMVVSAAMEDGQRRWRLDGKTGLYTALVAGAADWSFELQLATDGAKASATGALAAGARSGTVHAELKVHIDKADALAPWVSDVAALPMPIDVAATVQRTTAAVKIDALRLSIAGQSAAGQATVRTDAALPQVQLTLTSPSIDLSPWLGGKPSAAPAAARGAPAPLFSDTPLPAVVLPEFPVRADLRIERLVIPGMPTLAKVAAQIRSDPDRIVIEPLAFTLAEGLVRGRLELVARGHEPPRLVLSVAANALSLPALDATHNGGSRFRGGRLSVDASLALAGRTPHALVSSANGSALASASDVALAGGAAVLERNALVTLLDALLPKRQSNQSLTLSCAVVYLPLRNGVAKIDRSIAFETDQIAVAASGELNLVTQSVLLGFHPVVKKGLGLNPASLANLVTVRGPLHDPGVGIDVAGTAREAATVGAAVATGGLTLLGSRLIGREEDTQVCRHAAAGQSAAGPAGKREPSPAPSSRR